MGDKEHPISVMCDVHVIPMLMFLDENGPRCKTEIYAAVGRSASMPQKIDRMVSAGLVEVSTVGISEIVGLTELGRSIAGRLREIDRLMLDDRKQRP